MAVWNAILAAALLAAGTDAGSVLDVHARNAHPPRGAMFSVGPRVLRGGGGVYGVTLARHSPGTQRRRRRRDQRRRRGRR